MASLADLIREARVRKRLSLREVESSTGIRNAHLSQIETGTIKKPSTAILYGLSECLELDYHELMRAAGRLVPTGSPDAAAELHGLAAYRGRLTVEQMAELEKFAEMLSRRNEDP